MRNFITFLFLSVITLCYAEVKDVVMPCNTLYSGRQNITVGDSITPSGQHVYILLDQGRKIHTLDAYHSSNDSSDKVIAVRNYAASSSDYVFTADDLLNVQFSCHVDSLQIDFEGVAEDWDNPDSGPVTADDDAFLVKIFHNDSFIVASDTIWGNTIKSIYLQFDRDIQLGHDIMRFDLYKINNPEQHVLLSSNKYKDICVNNNKATSPKQDKEVERVEISFHVQADTRLPALDAHWGMQQTLDAYKTLFGRDSYDGNGSPIIQLINPCTSFFGRDLSLNALAYTHENENGTVNVMVYGMGGAKTEFSMNYLPIVPLDVMAHEFTHMVTNNNGRGGLVYESESGALNESMSDCLAMGVVNYAKGNVQDWKIGVECSVGEGWCMRQMSDPTYPLVGGFAKNPTAYHDPLWSDKGDVHNNSAVPNLAYTRLCDGSTGINTLGNAYSVQGIGLDKALQIVYHSLTHLYTPEMTMADARMAWLQSAAELYGEQSAAYIAVANAWYSVGIGEPISTDSLDSVSLDSDASVDIYTLDGRKLDGGTIPSGIYIRNGKKVVNH